MTAPKPRLQWLTPTSFLAYVALGAVVLMGLGSARSPAALALADAAAGAGHIDLAVRRYDAIAAVGPIAEHRETALWRAGNLLDVALHDAPGARERLRRLSVIEESELRTSALDRLGRLLQHHEHNPSAAAIAYEDAWRADPESPDAPGRLRRAARALEEAGDIERALGVWDQLGRTYPELSGRAQLGRAALHLIRDDEAAALAAYRDALESDDESVHAVARLGSATCLERLGNLDEALAELDAADLPEDVRDARAGTIRARIPSEE